MNLPLAFMFVLVAIAVYSVGAVGGVLAGIAWLVALVIASHVVVDRQLGE